MTTVETGLMARVYCGTYGKYNEGSIAGAWVDLTDYSSIEELYSYFKELHKDESDPEYMFQDLEVSDILKGKISEHGIDDDIYEVIEAIENSYLDIEVLEAYADHYSPKDYDNFFSDCEEAYQGEYKDDEDFAYEMAEDCGMLNDSAAWPHTCIDWAWAARELMYDYFSCNGHYFRNL